jgi:hypothetical protein
MGEILLSRNDVLQFSQQARSIIPAPIGILLILYYPQSIPAGVAAPATSVQRSVQYVALTAVGPFDGRRAILECLAAYELASSW